MNFEGAKFRAYMLAYNQMNSDLHIIKQLLGYDHIFGHTFKVATNTITFYTNSVPRPNNTILMGYNVIFEQLHTVDL